MTTEQIAISSHAVKGTEIPDDDASASGSLQASLENRNGWRNLVDRPLIEWGRNPEAFGSEEEGLEPPSIEIIQRAVQIASTLSETGVPSPLRVVMNGEGGIIFEWRDQKTFSTLEITKERHLELCRFDECRLVERERIL